MSEHDTDKKSKEKDSDDLMQFTGQHQEDHTLDVSMNPQVNFTKVDTFMETYEERNMLKGDHACPDNYFDAAKKMHS